MKRLQVKIGDGWQYVFCRNAQSNMIVTTDNRLKALPSHALEFFQSKYANHEFRIVGGIE